VLGVEDVLGDRAEAELSDVDELDVDVEVELGAGVGAGEPSKPNSPRSACGCCWLLLLLLALRFLEAAFDPRWALVEELLAACDEPSADGWDGGAATGCVTGAVVVGAETCFTLAG